jgi:hypothetical protein
MSTRFAIYLLLIIILFLTGMVRFKNLTMPFRILTILFGVTAISESTGRYLARKIHNSSPTYHFFNPIQFVLYLMIFYILIENKLVKKLILVLGCFASFLFILNSIFVQNIYTLPSNAIVISSICYVLLSLLLFKQMLANPSSESLSKQSVFWLNCNIIIFFSTTFFIWSFYNTFIKNYVPTKIISTFNYYLTFLFYLVMLIALILDKKRSALNETF